MPLAWRSRGAPLRFLAVVSFMVVCGGCSREGSPLQGAAEAPSVGPPGGTTLATSPTATCLRPVLLQGDFRPIAAIGIGHRRFPGREIRQEPTSRALWMVAQESIRIEAMLPLSCEALSAPPQELALPPIEVEIAGACEPRRIEARVGSRHIDPENERGESLLAARIEAQSADQPVMLLIDNAGGTERSLRVGDALIAVPPGRQRRRILTAGCRGPASLSVDGRAVGRIPPGSDPAGGWILDLTGRRCYELATDFYSPGLSLEQRTPRRRRLEPAHLHHLARVPDYVFRESPGSIQMGGVGTASRTSVYEVPCR